MEDCITSPSQNHRHIANFLLFHVFKFTEQNYHKLPFLFLHFIYIKAEN